ncbi:MAG TPA: PHP domain-containing protein, partial [Aggregatilineales bacterium]|nr:PHP domain-containing protein [Aggregatilineales bacterium]
MRVDLHLHSTASDGIYSPKEVIQIALTHNLDAVALTDHDSVGGVDSARRAAEGKPLEVLPGIELSCRDGSEDRDLLAYLFDIEDTPLLNALVEVREDRVRRAEKIVARLAEMGMSIPLETVRKQVSRGTVGRPHIARALLEHGYVTSFQEAFDRYLHDGGPADIPHLSLDPAQAIQLVHAAGGIVVLAHPVRCRDYRSVIERLVPLGLDGVEVYYPDHTPEIIEDLRQIAR